MINKETYRDTGKAYENCLTDNVEMSYSAYSDGFYLCFLGEIFILNKTKILKSEY